VVVTALAACGAQPDTPPGPRPSSPPGAEGSCSPGVTLDGFSDALDKTSFDGTYVGNLSALTGTGVHVLALSDRSALFTLDAATLRPTAVVALRDEQGRPLDSEALTVEPDGTLLITSEVEPSIRHYGRDGTLLGGRLPVPTPLLVAPAGRASRNLTFEGLTLQPDGRTLVASMEAGLDGDRGDLVRFQTWVRAGETNGAGEFRLGPQYAYRVDMADGVSEITATGDGRLLVLERGYLPGFGNTVRIYLADPGHATDVSGVDRLMPGPGITPISKTLLADLARCPSLGATARQPEPNPLLDNVEGMTVLRRDPDGALHLLLCSDDNHNPTQTTRLYRLTVRLPR
jgi:hypothetical protein